MNTKSTFGSLFHRSRAACAAFIVAASIFPGPAGSASGIPVFDGATFSQAVLNAIESVNQTLKQIEQYRTQLMQYENMIQNTIGPTAYVWDQAQQMIGNVMNEVNTINYYRERLGNLDAYLAKFQNVNYYRGSPCFSKAGCSEAERKQLNDVRELASEAVKKANDSLVKVLDLQQENFSSDARTITRLQTAAQTAEGQVQAIGYANQIAANQAHQLLQIRGLLVAQQNAGAAVTQYQADARAREEAAAMQIREGNFIPSTARGWSFP